MRVLIGPKAAQERPLLARQLWDIAVKAQELDPDIHLHGLLVKVRRSRLAENWEGNAWPEERTWDVRQRHLYLHPAGKVTMSIGSKVAYPDVVRLFAHELRHIGQFHRGRYHTGFLGTGHMVEVDIEPDCYDFEDMVLAKMGMPSDYECYVPPQVFGQSAAA
jgi:hypothetical protein